MTTEEENFQCWLEKNWDRPLSDEVERLQDELKRLEITHEADIRRLQRVESEWRSLLRKAFLVCLGLVALLLWYMNSYSEMRAALNVAAHSSRVRRARSSKRMQGESSRRTLKRLTAFVMRKRL